MTVKSRKRNATAYQTRAGNHCTHPANCGAGTTITTTSKTGPKRNPLLRRAKFYNGLMKIYLAGSLSFLTSEVWSLDSVASYTRKQTSVTNVLAAGGTKSISVLELVDRGASRLSACFSYSRLTNISTEASYFLSYSYCRVKTSRRRWVWLATDRRCGLTSAWR